MSSFMNEVMFSLITCQRAMMDHRSICKWLTVCGKLCMASLQYGHRGSLTVFSFHSRNQIWKDFFPTMDIYPHFRALVVVIVIYENKCQSKPVAEIFACFLLDGWYDCFIFKAYWMLVDLQCGHGRTFLGVLSNFTLWIILSCRIRKQSACCLKRIYVKWYWSGIAVLHLVLLSYQNLIKWPFLSYWILHWLHVKNCTFD